MANDVSRSFYHRIRFPSALTPLLIFLTSCSTNTCEENKGKVLQVYTAANEIVRTYQVDHGASGYSVTLTICDKADNRLLEEIGLRGESYLPTIDSVVGSNIFIHYSFPEEEKKLDFDDVALGKALLSPEKLKYKYIIWNKKALKGVQQ